jgi:hypothetical protein
VDQAIQFGPFGGLDRRDVDGEGGHGRKSFLDYIRNGRFGNGFSGGAIAINGLSSRAGRGIFRVDDSLLDQSHTSIFGATLVAPRLGASLLGMTVFCVRGTRLSFRATRRAVRHGSTRNLPCVRFKAHLAEDAGSGPA